MKAIFPGRLQPLHKGHKKVIEEYKDEYDDFIVVIGSSNESRMRENPLTFEERKKLVESCFPDIGVEGVEDNPSNTDWIETMMARFDPDVVISQNDLVKRLFRENTDVEVVEQELENKEVYSGTEIRRRIRSGEEWRYLVPECSKELMEEFLEIFKDTGIQYEFKPGWKKENAFYGTEEDDW